MFFLISGNLVAQKWRRFGRLVLNDYFYMSETYWDAVKFTPKMDVFILGFALMNHYEKQPWQLIFKYSLDSDESEEY